MIKFQEKKYQLFFSNNLEPLRALNYADETFFSEFEKLCGSRYKIISIIRNGWQEKYGLVDDIENLKKSFKLKLDQDNWADLILSEYDIKKDILIKTLTEENKENYSASTNENLADTLIKVRSESATLDAMSNMLHLFSSLIGGDFIIQLNKYSSDPEIINQNFIYFTQPIKESKYAKILLTSIENKINLNKTDENLSKILRVGSYIKDDVSALLEDRGKKLAGLFKEIAKRLLVDENDMLFLTIPEIKTLLTKSAEIRNLVNSREKITIIFYPNKNLEIYEGKKAESFLLDGKFIEVLDNNHDLVELKGQVASLGKVTGRALVVKNSDEAMKQITENDILVAPYTAPEYLPAMKKAKAIITETGGITSHAAIVSRELKIPCVIGIADVTSILKTGDMIEVDANSGIVRIIK